MMLLEQLPELFAFIASSHREHARGTVWYRFTDTVVKAMIAEARPIFEAGKPISLGELGDVVLPYHRMGAVDTLDLFGLDELILFAFYWRNRDRYPSAIDIGANVGLHSIVLGKLGCSVKAFEPDPQHFTLLGRNLSLNGVEKQVTPMMMAVSDNDGEMEFVRVLGNTTSSHLAGAKSNPYGELERFPVKVVGIRPFASEARLAKIDAEGHEAVLLRAIDSAGWTTLDAFVEIGTPENADLVFNHLSAASVNIFAQKIGWGRVSRLEDMPTTYKEGSIFVSKRSEMTW